MEKKPVTKSSTMCVIRSSYFLNNPTDRHTSQNLYLTFRVILDAGRSKSRLPIQAGWSCIQAKYRWSINIAAVSSTDARSLEGWTPDSRSSPSASTLVNRSSIW